MLVQNFGGQTKSVMVFSEVAYYAALALVVQAIHPSGNRELGEMP